jgi:RHS repeat-associated protein
VLETIKSDLDGAIKTNQSAYEHDNLGRCSDKVVNLNHITRNGYDSVGNRTIQVDALGNRIHWGFDGLGRHKDTEYSITEDGSGASRVIDRIKFLQIWDDSSRLIMRADDNQNATAYHYDSANNRVRIAFADGTQETAKYDKRRILVERVDRSGNHFFESLDRNGRCKERHIVPGAGVAEDTTFEEFGYDGLGRVVLARDNDSTVRRVFDSLSRIVSEVQSWGNEAPLSVELGWNAIGQKELVRYPNGLTVTNKYGPLGELKAIIDNDGLVCAVQYFGGNRPVQRAFGNGNLSALRYDSHWNIVSMSLENGLTGEVLELQTNAWDLAGNNIAKWRSGGFDRRYAFDSAYRLVESKVVGGTSVRYAYDGAQNRISVLGGPGAGHYSMKSQLPEPADAQMNQYTATPFGLRNYDKNGSLTSGGSVGGVRTNVFDVNNRLVRSSLNGGESWLAYDAFGRLIANGSRSGKFLWAYDGWQRVWSRDLERREICTFVYGAGINEVVKEIRGGVQTYYHLDDLSSVMRLSGPDGRLVDSFDYYDYGQSFGDSLAKSGFRFAGHWYDVDLRLSYMRSRFYEPDSGRFLSADSKGAWHDIRSFGNAFTYGGNNPVSRVDLFGFESSPPNFGGFSYQLGGFQFSGPLRPEEIRVIGPKTPLWIPIDVLGLSLEVPNSSAYNCHKVTLERYGCKVDAWFNQFISDPWPCISKLIDDGKLKQLPNGSHLDSSSLQPGDIVMYSNQSGGFDKILGPEDTNDALHSVEVIAVLPNGEVYVHGKDRYDAVTVHHINNKEILKKYGGATTVFRPLEPILY